jgi:phosphatidylglycerol:prolipoprotein diacylglycerol transferase
MIPYFELRTIPITDDISLAVFGKLVAVGVWVGIFVARSRARAVGIDEAELRAAIVWAVIPGFLVAHLVALWPHLGTRIAWTSPRLFEFWNGMSSFGGFLGALVGLTIFHYRRAVVSWVSMAEVLTQALVVGWVFGRLGCTLVHDHIGRPSAFWLAVRFPDGPRHDLGLYELIYTVLILLPAVVLLNGRPRPAGATIAWIALLYAPARFLADFLRSTDLPGSDPRYFGLTWAQYACVVLAAFGVFFLRRVRACARPAAA